MSEPINSTEANTDICIWKHICITNNIDLTNTFSVITSNDVKKCKESWKGKQNQFEPRLLCKMDSSKSRPQIFIDNNICILSIKNGVYALIKENIYAPLNKYQCVPIAFVIIIIV